MYELGEGYEAYKHCNTCDKVLLKTEFYKAQGRCKECCKAKRLCQHGKDKYFCAECGGSQICKHGKQLYHCKECGGGAICEHGRNKFLCKECRGKQLCVHNIQRSRCRKCGGGAICEHDKQRTRCPECGGGAICEHGNQRYLCIECDGGGICEHKTERKVCKICDPLGHLRNIVSGRMRHALQSDKTERSIEYLGCTIEEFKEHITKQFKEGMDWNNYGEWEIDHIIPIKYNEPTLEEVIERLHYTNTQPLWKPENAAKGNRYIG